MAAVEAESVITVEQGDAVSISEVDLVSTPCTLEASDPFASTTYKNKKTYSWLSKISTINLELCGSDMSQRIELSCPNGMTLKTDIRRRRDERGNITPDQKQFSILNSNNEKLLTVDFSRDRKSFHIMEPDSDNFIAFFTVNGAVDSNRVEIFNVVDDEKYLADPTDTPYRFLIKSEKGEELGIVTKPSPKWTRILNGTITLNFTGDERDGLTSREKAILLGFLIAVGIFGMDYWKRSSSGLLTVYIISIILFSALVILIYCGLSSQQDDQKSSKRRVHLFLPSVPGDFNMSAKKWISASSAIANKTMSTAAHTST